MSFNWNLSSDEEDDELDLEEWTKRNGFQDQDRDDNDDDNGNKKGSTSHGTTVNWDQLLSSTKTSLNAANASDSDEEEVDWEDADENDDDIESSTKGSQPPLKPVTIRLGKQQDDDKEQDEPPSKKRRKRRERVRFESMLPHQQIILIQIHRTHLLAMVSRAVGISQHCSRFDNDELTAVALSLIPSNFAIVSTSSHGTAPPTLAQVEQLTQWFADWVHRAAQRRHERVAANRRAGAPRRPGGSRRRRRRSSGDDDDDETTTTTNTTRLVHGGSILEYARLLSQSEEDDAQLYNGGAIETASDLLKLALFVTMTRALGWRTRFVGAIQSIPLDLSVDHPMFATGSSSEAADGQLSFLDWAEVYCSSQEVANGKNKMKKRWIHVDPIHQLVNQPHRMEAIWKKRGSSGGASPSNKRGGGKTISSNFPGYVVAVEHRHTHDSYDHSNIMIPHRLTDVTARYSASWVEALRQRGVIRGKTKIHHGLSWWSDTLQTLNGGKKSSTRKKKDDTLTSGESTQSAIVLSDGDEPGDPPAAAAPIPLPHDADNNEDEHDEAEELRQSASREAIPTSKAAFRTHPIYVIPSVLGVAEVLHPQAKVCGLFKGQRVYRRSDVSTARPARKWSYFGRRVQDGVKPVKKVKARKKPAKKSFRALTSYGVGKANDGSQSHRDDLIADAERQAARDAEALEMGDEEWLYGEWQTDAWAPTPVGPTDPIPVNEHRNVELALLPVGLAHVDVRGSAAVAKKLGIPYAPCLVGFEGHGGNRTPSVVGIVVHSHNEVLVREATQEVQHHEEQTEREKRKRAVLTRWKKLMVGLLTKERLEREYGSDSDSKLPASA